MNQVPPPTPENFDAAARAFDAAKPGGTKIAGLAIITATINLILWSVNYEVVSDAFPTPSASNCTAAKAKFQRQAPAGTTVKTVCVCQIKPGGLVLSKWQVTYTVNLRASGVRTSPQNRKSKPIKVKVCKRSPLKFIKEGEKPSITDRLESKIRHLEQRFDKWLTVHNIRKFSNATINSWVSRKKRNAAYALKRIVNKVSSAAAPEKEKRRDKVMYTAVPPPYKDMECKTYIYRINRSPAKDVILGAIATIHRCSDSTKFSARLIRAGKVLREHGLQNLTVEERAKILDDFVISLRMTNFTQFAPWLRRCNFEVSETPTSVHTIEYAHSLCGH